MDNVSGNQDSSSLNEYSNPQEMGNTADSNQAQTVQTEDFPPAQKGASTLTQNEDLLSASDPAVEQTSPNNPDQPKAKSKKSINPLLIILIIILISLSVSALLYWLFYYRPSQKTPPLEEAETTIIPTPTTIEEISTATSSANVVDANNQFALDYYSVIKDKEDGNIFYSPFSISSALAITYEGAKGKTAEEMATVLHFPTDLQVLRNEYQNLYSQINKENKSFQLNTANALWAQKDYPFLNDYLSTIEKYYKGTATNLDFANDTENSRITINNWVEDQTNNKIQNLIPQGVLDPLTRLVLTNAIYFKGEWVSQFNEEETLENYPFENGSETIEVDMMQRTDDESEFNYAENDQLQILQMPYSGEELSMLILLPKNEDLNSLENSLNIENLNDWKQNLKNQRVDIYIPKFKFETKYMMADDLIAMGMPTAFSGGADFSGMDGTQNLYIGSVIHQAFVEVNEEGTESAAATAVVMELSMAIEEGPTIPVFRADHPFIFIIQDNLNGNILFIGRVTNPTQSS